MKSDSQPSSVKPKARHALLIGLALFFCAVFTALGVWQVERLSWKRELIARVDARVHAAPAPVPAPANWPTINAADDEYRHVTARGRLLNEKDALVYASTALGPGYWVMTPLEQADGVTVLVNRGFVPLDRKDPRTRAEGAVAGEVTVTGLLRIDEPKGTLLRSNVPADDRWYSRDVTAIAASRGLENVAPFFIDADATANPGGLPVGGLTVVRFPDSHLSYAVTWFVLALMSLAGGVIAVRAERRR